MLKIAIVGNIAAGKTTVENLLKDYSYAVYDTDKIAHKILENSQEVKDLFGTTDRKKIAQMVFSNKDKLTQLESIIHPQVKLELLKIFSEEKEIVFISVPQLFESGFDTMFDKIIYVTAPEDIRKKRLMARNNLTSEEAQLRLDAQTEAGKIEKSDFIIDNNKGLDELKKQVDAILSILVG